MQCAQAKNLIALLVGDDLGDAERPQVEQHLSECGSCRTYHGEMTESQKRLCSLAAVADTESPGLWDDVQSKVQLPNDIGTTKRTSKWTVALCTAALVMAMIGISKDLVTPASFNESSNGPGAIQTSFPGQPNRPTSKARKQADQKRDLRNIRLDEVR